MSIYCITLYYIILYIILYYIKLGLQADFTKSHEPTSGMRALADGRAADGDLDASEEKARHLSLDLCAIL